MNKKLLKTMRGLLVAAGLCVGANGAWADAGEETTVVDIDFTGASLTDGAGTVAGTHGSMTVATSDSRSPMRISDGSTVKFSRSGSEYVIPANILVVGTGTGTVNIAEADRVGYGKAENKDQVKVTFGMSFGNVNGGKNGFIIKDSEGTTVAEMSYGWYNGFGNNTFGLEASNLQARTAGEPAGLRSYLAMWESATTFTLIFDYKTNRMSIQTNAMADAKTIAMPTTNPIAQFIVNGTGIGNNPDRSGLFDNLVIKNIEGDYTTESADYTVNWKYNGSIIKTDSRSGDVGTNPVLTSADKEAFISGDNKYLYADDDADEVTIAKDNSSVVTVTLSVADKYAYTVKAVEKDNTSNVLQTLISATYHDGETVYYAWPRYVNVDGTLYEQQQSSWNGASLKGSFTLDEAKTINVEYAATSITNVSFLVEGEDIEGANELTGGNFDARASGAKAGYSGSALTMTTLPAGVYSMFIDLATPTRPNNYTFGGAGVSILSSEFSKNNHVTFTRNFTLTTSTTITFQGGDSADGLDYLYIQKTADLPSTEKIQVTSAGLATYVSNYNLDFSEATTKAYKVNVAEKGVATLTEVSKVPAKTPVLLYCEGGNGEGENIAVTTDAVDAVTGNNLVAGAGAAVATVDGDYTNMILNNVESKIGFYFANGQTVAGNRAYLHIATELAPDAASAAGMTLVFADEATGINAIDNGQLLLQPERPARQPAAEGSLHR